jgi:hypothetical protein
MSYHRDAMLTVVYRPLYGCSEYGRQVADVRQHFINVLNTFEYGS